MTAALPTRRGFLGRALALAPTAALGGLVLGDVAQAATAPDTPIRAIFRRYNAALHAHRSLLEPGEWTPSVELAPFRQAMEEAREAMRAEPITNLEDLGLKAMVVTGYLSGPEHELAEECIAFLRSIQ